MAGSVDGHLGHVGEGRKRVFTPALEEVRALSSQAKSEFQDVIAQPLTIIRGHAQMLGMKLEEDPETFRATRQICGAVDRLMRDMKALLGIEL